MRQVLTEKTRHTPGKLAWGLCTQKNISIYPCSCSLVPLVHCPRASGTSPACRSTKVHCPQAHSAPRLPVHAPGCHHPQPAVPPSALPPSLAAHARATTPGPPSALPPEHCRHHAPAPGARPTQGACPHAASHAPTQAAGPWCSPCLPSPPRLHCPQAPAPSPQVHCPRLPSSGTGCTAPPAVPPRCTAPMLPPWPSAALAVPPRCTAPMPPPRLPPPSPQVHRPQAALPPSLPKLLFLLPSRALPRPPPDSVRTQQGSHWGRPWLSNEKISWGILTRRTFLPR